MDKGSRTLGWLGLIVGGGLSIGANIRSIHLPDMPAADLGSYVVAVAPVMLAMLGIEQVARWSHLHPALRYGVVGIASLIAVAASWTHIVSVLQHYGQAPMIAYGFPFAVDGIMLLSSVAMFAPSVQPDTDTDRSADTDIVARTGTPAPDMDSLAADNLESLSEVDKAVLSSPVPDSVPDMDTLPAAPIMVPAPRRSRPDPAWKADALDMIRRGEPASDREIAEKILADRPETWPTVEAGRKAVARLRTAA